MPKKTKWQDALNHAQSLMETHGIDVSGDVLQSIDETRKKLENQTEAPGKLSVKQSKQKITTYEP